MNYLIKIYQIKTFIMELIKIQNIPILDIGRRIGHTEYIDFLQWDEVEYPIMKGVDIYIEDTLLLLK